MVQIDIMFEDARWDAAGLPNLAQIACDATLTALGLTPDWEVSILACSDSRIAELNSDFRDKPTPTNVLSWPSDDRAADQAGGAPDLPQGPDPELGDIAIAYGVCNAEATEQGKPFNHHVIHLLIHATLHLLGYDHIHDQDAALMEGLEARILANLGIADPY